MSIQEQQETPPLAHNDFKSNYFTEKDLATLRLVCDTLIPALAMEDPHGHYRRRASDLDIHNTLATAIEDVADPDLIGQLRLFLSTIENPLFNLVLSGQGQAFSSLSLEERTTLLQSWEISRLNIRRKAFQSLKRLAMMLFYSVTNEQKNNPNWAAIAYNGPPRTRPDHPRTTIKPLRVDGAMILHTDVVIVGSGAGGGVVAGELSAAGLDVVVLEKGGFYVETDFDGDELGSTERLFENKGLLTTSDLGMVILAGSTLGGGTTVNWAASFRTPEHVLREWERDYQVADISGTAYQASMDAVSERINVNTDCAPTPQNSILESGAQALGFANEVIPRNTRDCEECGFCNFGCQFGAKQGTLRTYLQDAYDQGARIAVRAYVERVLIENGRAVGVEGTIQDAEGRHYPLVVHAERVVIAAGALHSPAILMRSGLGNQHIGRNLHLHPTTVSYGIYETEIRGWQGAPMSRYVSEFKNLDGNGYGAALETAPIHPGIGAMSLSWENGRQHKDIMRQIANLSNIIIITRDYHGGRIRLNRQGALKIDYSLHRDDAKHMMRGLLESLRIHQAAGAYHIGAPKATPLTWNTDEDFDTYLQEVAQLSLAPNRIAMFSAHQMSSCRMGGNPARGAIAPNGESYEVKGLYVADASVLPTATGVNPMVTIMSIAHYIAQHIKAEA